MLALGSFVRSSVVGIVSTVFTGWLLGQTPNARIAPNPDLQPMTRLSGHLPHWVTPAADVGEVPDATPVRLNFVLARPAARQAAFEQMLSDQQNPASPLFQRWLTPAQIGEQFGPALEDVEAVTQWLTSRGLTVESVSPSRTFVQTTGTTGAAAAALATTFHTFLLDGQGRLSATSEPAVPVALAAVLTAIDGLTEIPMQPYHRSGQAPPRNTADAARPLYSASGNTLHYLFPGDFANIYDVTATTGAGYTGTGVKVAIIGRSQITASDITELETLAGLPSKVQNVVLVPTSPDPGLVKGDEDESTLDVGRVLTIAPGAQADLVIAASANGGITAAIQYNVNVLLDPVMTISYGNCEAAVGSANVTYFDALFATAAMEGISTFVSSGDSGAAGCSAAFTAPKGTETLAMGNYLCASSYVTCLGGTEFADTASPASYWSSTNSTTYVSALGYIPEGGWNEPSYQTTSNGVTTTGYQLVGSGGGPSLYIKKPTWQGGAVTPQDSARDIPDLAFSAAGHDGYFACLAYVGASYDCSKGGGVIFSGTSAAAPDMAAVAAILNQRMGKPQGNLNPAIYALAASTPAVFHDATPATSGVATCAVTTASMCNNSTPGVSSLTGLSGYPLQVGYDLVTGLGSVDVTRFINAVASGAALPATTTVVSATPATIIVGATAVFTANVTGSGTQTGTLQFSSNGTALGSPVTLAGGKASTPATQFPTTGTYAIAAVYSGDSANAGSTSTALNFTVAADTALGLAITATPATLTLAAGATTGNTSTINLTTTRSYSGPVALTCAVSFSGGTAVYAPTCSFPSTSVTFAAVSTGSSVITLTTTIPHTVSGGGQMARGAFAPAGGLWVAALLLLLLPGKRRRRALPSALPLVLLGAGLMALAGCGSSGSSQAAAPVSTPVGTSKGAYTISVTATPGDGATATTTITLNVQ